MDNKYQTDFRVNANHLMHHGYAEYREVFFQTKEEAGGEWSPEIKNTVLNVKNGVVAVLYDPAADIILLTSEFRIATVARDEAAASQIPLGQRPTGRLLGCVLGAAKPGEDFESVARKEAKEESKQEVGRAVVGPTFFISGSIMPNFVTSYVLEFDSSKVKDGTSAGLASEGENIQVKLYSLPQLNNLLDELSLDKTTDATSYTALSWFLRKQPVIKAQWLGLQPAQRLLPEETPDAAKPQISTPV